MEKDNKTNDNKCSPSEQKKNETFTKDRELLLNRCSVTINKKLIEKALINSTLHVQIKELNKVVDLTVQSTESIEELKKQIFEKCSLKVEQASSFSLRSPKLGILYDEKKLIGAYGIANHSLLFLQKKSSSSPFSSDHDLKFSNFINNSGNSLSEENEISPIAHFEITSKEEVMIPEILEEHLLLNTKALPEYNPLTLSPSISKVLEENKTCVNDFSFLNLSPERNPIVSHISVHLKGSKSNFDLNNFKEELKNQMNKHSNVNFDNIIILSVEDGTVWIKLTVKQMMNSSIQKMDAFINNVNDAVDRMCEKSVGKFEKLACEFIKLKKSEKFVYFPSYEEVLELSQVIPVATPEAENWMKHTTQDLEQCIQRSLKNCKYEFVLQNISLIINKSLWERFQIHFNEDLASCPLLFHGTHTDYYDSIFEKGFIISGKLDAGFFFKKKCTTFKIF